MSEGIVFGVTGGLLSLVGLIAIFVSINTQYSIEKSREILLELTNFMEHYPKGSYESRHKLNWYLQNFIRLTKITLPNFIVITISTFTIVFVIYTWIHYYLSTSPRFILAASFILLGFIVLILMLSKIITVGGLVKSEVLMTLNPNNKFKVLIPLEKIILSNTVLNLDGRHRKIKFYFPYAINIEGSKPKCYIMYSNIRIDTFYEEKACPITKSKKYRKSISFTIPSTYDHLYLDQSITVRLILNYEQEELSVPYYLPKKLKWMFEAGYYDEFPDNVLGGTSLSLEGNPYKKNRFYKLNNVIEKVKLKLKLNNEPKTNKEAYIHFEKKINNVMKQILNGIKSREGLTVLKHPLQLSENKELLTVTSDKSKDIIRITIKELLYNLETSYESLITLSIIINDEEKDTFNYIPLGNNKFNVNSLLYDQNKELYFDVLRYILVTFRENDGDS